MICWWLNAQPGGVCYSYHLDRNGRRVQEGATADCWLQRAAHPALYFFADEIAIALRAFTNGYDLFHPHEILGWHLYDRATRATHWSDHVNWLRQHEASLDRLAALYAGQLKGRHGIGSVRSVGEFEAHIGLPLIER